MRRATAALIALALAIPLATAAQASAALEPGAVIVADSDLPGLVLVDPATGKQSVLSSNLQPVNANSQLFGGPSDVEVLPSGQLLVSDYSSRRVIRVDPDTGKQTLVSANDQAVNSSSQLFSQPSGIALLPSGQIVVLDRSFNGVIAVDPGTGKESELSSNDQAVNASSQHFTDPRGGIAVSRSGSLLAADCSAFGGIGGLIGIAPASGKQSKVAANDQPVNATSQFFGCPTDVILAPSGRVLVADQAGAAIAVDPATGKETTISDGQLLNNPSGVARALDGRILISLYLGLSSAGCGDSEGCGGVVAIDPPTGAQTLLSSNGQAVNASSRFFSTPDGITVMPPRCSGRLATIAGTAKGEKIVGTPGADVIAALGGKDTVRALGGNDLVCGGGGPDLIRGGKGRDRLLGQAGKDGLFGQAGRDVLVGGGGRDLLRGGPGRDRQKQ